MTEITYLIEEGLVSAKIDGLAALKDNNYPDYQVVGDDLTETDPGQSWGYYQGYTYEGGWLDNYITGLSFGDIVYNTGFNSLNLLTVSQAKDRIYLPYFISVGYNDIILQYNAVQSPLSYKHQDTLRQVVLSDGYKLYTQNNIIDQASKNVNIDMSYCEFLPLITACSDNYESPQFSLIGNRWDNIIVDYSFKFDPAYSTKVTITTSAKIFGQTFPGFTFSWR